MHMKRFTTPLKLRRFSKKIYAAFLFTCLTTGVVGISALADTTPVNPDDIVESSEEQLAQQKAANYYYIATSPNAPATSPNAPAKPDTNVPTPVPPAPAAPAPMAQTPILAPAPAVVSVPLKKIIVTTKKISLQTKASRKLSVIKVPSNTTEALKYTSSKPKVVSVSSNGKLKAKKPGKAKITISGANTKQTITVTVSKQSMPTKKLSFKKKALKVKKGTVRFLPYKINAASNQKIIWKSSKKAVVSVDSNGKITAKKKGKAIITLKSGKEKTTCKITVK